MKERHLQLLRDSESDPLRIHLIGVAGSGMSGLAALLLRMGHKVQGCDRVTTQETDRLQGEGLQFFCPQTAEGVQGADLVIYSSAIRPGNAAYDAAADAGIPMVRRAEALAAVMDQKKGIVVSGTHGKTTTSAMAAHVLRGAGVKPSHYVGAEIPLLGNNAQWEESSDYFVAEGDESDGTLALFRPEHAIVLNLEAEHLDFYDGIEAIRKVFRQLLDQTRGSVIYCGNDPGATGLCEDREGALSYGFDPGMDYAAIDIEERAGGSEFRVVKNGSSLGEMRLNIPGRHNVLNAMSVVALATELGVTFGVIKAALGTFQGAKRRFQKKYASASYRFYDDYGHHPTEIRATVETARSLQPKRIVCAFQPHRYTRTQLLRDEFGTAFNEVDQLVVTDIYPASESPIPGITGQTICDSVQERGQGVKARFIPDKREARLRIGNELQEGDLVLSLGAGDIHEITTDLARDVEILEELREALDEKDANLKLYEPMKKHTTMRLGGPAQFWAEPRTVAGFARLVRFCRERNLPVRVIGRGSNLLVRDGGIPGIVIHPAKGDFAAVETRGDLIEAGVGAKLKQITLAAQSAGLEGMEWMEGIPGNLGGGIRMNAGAMGGEMFDHVVSVSYLDEEGELRTKMADEIDFRYRSVPEFTRNYVVSAVLKGSPGDEDKIAERIEASKQKRKETQPIAACAGCIFKNPGEIPAGKLVDELGLKDAREGEARVSNIHGNFIVNEGSATAADVLKLIRRIQKEAREKRGIELETEVQIIGEETFKF